MNKGEKQTNRLIHLDLLRLIAIYLVIFNHTGSRGFMLFAERMESPFYAVYMLCSVGCKVAVPLFFMISGALLLPKQESLRTLFSRRVFRMLFVLLVVSVPYYIWLHSSEGLNPMAFLSYIYGNSASTSLWYLYSYIALLLMMPFLRNMVKGMKREDFIYLLIGYLLMVGVRPCLEQCLWGEDKILHPSFEPVLFLSESVFFALAGYYTEHRFDMHKCSKRLCVSVGVLNAFFLSIMALMTHQLILSGESDPSQLERFFGCFICIPTISLYLLVKSFSKKIKSPTLRNILSSLGGAVFGVYLIEKFGRKLTEPIYILLEPMIGSFASSLLWCMSVFVLCLAIVILSKHTPVVRKVVDRFI